MPSLSKVCFFFESNTLTLKDRGRLKGFLLSIFKRERTPLSSINFIFCTDERILEINRQFLQHDFYTDIITFDLSTSIEKIAEVYISLDRVRENASVLQATLRSELHRVIFHGVLHLCGYADKSASDIKLMRKKEDYYLKSYFGTVPRGK